jgi:hypothetical protein
MSAILNYGFPSNLQKLNKINENGAQFGVQ